MAYNDKQNSPDGFMSLNNTNYNSIICEQGKLLDNQRNKFENNVREGFTSSVVEGFHEEIPSRIGDEIQEMNGWMKREFSELDNIQEGYVKEGKKYNRSDEKFGVKSRNYLTRTTKDNNFNGKTIKFKDGEIGYVTKQGFLRDYDPETYAKVGDMNKCGGKLIETEISREDFLKSDSQKLGPKMLLNKSDIRTIRFRQNGQYFHVSEIEALDDQNQNVFIPKDKNAEVSFYCRFGINENEYKSSSDNYNLFLTYNGADISEGNSIPVTTFPEIKGGPEPISFSSETSYDFVGIKRASKHGKDVQGMRMMYFEMKNSSGFNKGVYWGDVHNIGDINFNWGSGKIIGNRTDLVGIHINGYIKSPVTGTINLYSDSDDGQGFWWNGTKLWDGLNLGHGRTDAGRYFANVEVTEGKYYLFDHKWREGGGGANLRLFWTLPGKGRTIIPANYFTIGGNGGESKRIVLSKTFTNVKNVVNGFRIEHGENKLSLTGRVEVWLKPKNVSWSYSNGMQYLDSSNDPYKVIKISDKVKVSIPPHNPFIVSATISTGHAYSGFPHFPLDGNKNNDWPNSVHSATTKNIVYDIVIDREMADIEKIRIRNRADGSQYRLNGTRMQLLDGEGKLIKEFRLDASQEQTYMLNNEPRGTSCGSEGKNVMVTKIGEIGDAEYVGCYKDTGNRRMKWEGKWGTYEDCKQYAIDNKSPYFALQASNPNKDVHACMIGKDLNKAISYGEKSGKCPDRPYSKSFGPVGSGWTNAIYALDKTNYEKVNEKVKNISDTIDTSTGGSLADCMNKCEENGECSAFEYDAKVITKSGLPELKLGSNNSGSSVRVNNRNIDKYLELGTYEYNLTLKIQKNNSGWRNVFHHGNSNGERSPALWIYPNVATSGGWKMHFRIRSTKNTNDGFNFVIPKQYQSLNKKLRLRLVIDNTYTSEDYFIMKTWVNGVASGSQQISGKIDLLKGRSFFIKDPWFNRSGYVVKDIVLKDTYGKQDVGKCDLKETDEVTTSNNNSSDVYNKLVSRPFKHGIGNLGKIGYIDEKGILHKYPNKMVSTENMWEMKMGVDSPGNDIKSMTTNGIEEARDYANKNPNIAGFVRHTDGRTWFKGKNMWPFNPNGRQRYYRSAQLHYKKKTFRNNDTCTNDVEEITTTMWGNYNKGSDMGMNTKCGISKYTDNVNRRKNMSTSKLNDLNDESVEKITKISQRRAMIGPFIKDANKTIGGLTDETEQNVQQSSDLLGIDREGREGMADMADMDRVYNYDISPGLPEFQEIAEMKDTTSALLGILGIAGVIMGASYMKK